MSINGVIIVTALIFMTAVRRQSMQLILLALVILLYSFQTLFCTMFNKKYEGNCENASKVFCVLEGVAIAVITLAFIGFRFSPSPLTWLIGVLNAAALLCYNTSMIKASERGSYAFMCISYLFGGLIVPLVYNSASLGNPISIWQIIAIAVMLLSFVLMNYEDINLHNTPVSYYVYCALLFISNGAYGTFLKMQSVNNDAESTQMIIITFALMGVMAFITLLLKEKKSTLAAFKINKSAIVPLVLCLIIAAAAINLLVYILPLIDLALLFPVEDGGVMVVSALFSIFIFKEKTTPLKICGMLLAVISIVSLSILGGAA